MAVGFDRLLVSAALMFGKSASPRTVARTQSVGVQWSDSDSSVDSMPSSGDENDPDWPSNPGFQVMLPLLLTLVQNWLIVTFLPSAGYEDN